MTGYVLEITLRSPLTSAAGEGRVGLVDRDVVFDNIGLPVLPGRRIKGLWSDAYQEVVDAWTLCGQQATPARRIFGQTGQMPGAGAALVRIGDARLQDAQSLEPWLAYLQQIPSDERLQSDEVRQHFAVVRAQTAMNRHTGAPQEDTLRLTRTLRQGLVFHAPLRFTQPPDASLLRALALGAAALQHMGTARTRGLGEVRCRLLALEEDGSPADLTDQAVAEDDLRSITVAGSADAPVNPGSPPTPPSFPQSRLVPTHLLRYRLTLTAPAVIPVADGDPNIVMTRCDIPGSSLWGFAAWHYLRYPGHTAHDTDFSQTFLDGELRFLPAFPESQDSDLLRLLPIPHSIRKAKYTEQLVDFVELRDARPDDTLQRIARGYARIALSRLETQGVKTQLNYHHARATDRRKGRALGADIPGGDGGAFFVYESLEAGQRFQGAVLGTQARLLALQTWLQGVEHVSIGRSRSAQYGGEARLEWLDDAPVALSDTAGEWSGFRSEEDESSDDEVASPTPTEYLVITTLSPLLAINAQGHPEARFPAEELATVLGLAAGDLKLLHSYTRTEQIGGYITHLRLPRQQWPAIAAGSVFVFDVSESQDRITPQNFLRLEYDGLGLRKGEGYGRIAVNRQGHLGLTGESLLQLDDPTNRMPPDAPETPEVPEVLQMILRHVIRMRCQESLEQSVIDEVQNMPSHLLPSSALLGRLDLILRQQPRTAARTTLERLRKPAMQQLHACRVSVIEKSWASLQQATTLYDLLTQALADPHAITRKLAAEHAENILEDRYADAREAIIATLVEEDSEAMVTGFLQTLLGAMRRKLKTQS